LRPPGHTLTEQLFELVERRDETLTSAVGAALLAAVLILPPTLLVSHMVGAPEVLADRKVVWLAVAGAFSALGAVLCGYRAHSLVHELVALKKEMHARRLGLRGEQAVAEVLHSLDVAGAGYVSFHDVPKASGGNIDHVVVGPGGVFVIETKTRSQSRPLPRRKRNRLLFDGRRASYPTGRYDVDAAEQAKRNAASLAASLTGIVPESAIIPLLVFPGWEVHMVERCLELKALSANQLRYFFRALPTRLDDAACADARKVLDEKCRDVFM